MPRTGRENVLATRASVIARYCGGETLKALAADFGVSDAWLKKQLTAWDVPVRGVREARVLRAQPKEEPMDEQQPPTCTTCDDLMAVEREARTAHDHSAATDARVLLRRHMDTDHRPRPDGA
ncbi:hypothetical protein ACFVIM_13885 [Streptomyces sp. NPDC057638]|uniref:hypothetical protein n=1 Tax=Streptomyces sp. NPDC057638 TaxID=3346190 RepID=UPI0036CDB738